MNNEEFLKNLNRDLKQSKEELQNKSEEVVKELNDYKSYLEEELYREKNKYSDKEQIDPMYSEIVRHDSEMGELDFDEMDDEGYDVITSVASKDPVFALNFLERRKADIPQERFEELKSNIIKKMI